MKDLLRIGEFARLCGVSVKALRFYAAQDLLEPDYVDADSGYRYYRIEQAKQLAVIHNLRAAGFSIKEIKALVASDLGADGLHELIAAKRERLLSDRRRIEEQLRIVDTLAQSLESGFPQPISTVKLTNIEAKLVYSIAATVPELGEAVTQIFETAETAVSQNNARAPSPPFLIFHDPPDKERDLNLEVCIPITENAVNRIDARQVEGHQLACSVVYGGDYAQTVPLMSRMCTWLKSVGLAVAGPLREVYHRFGADQHGYTLPANVIAADCDQFRTELLLPISVDSPSSIAP